MRVNQSIFKRGKPGAGARKYARPWTLRLTHIDDQGKSTSKTWQYATKQDAKDDVDKRKAELAAYVETKGQDLGDIRTFRQWAEYAKADFYRPAVIREGRKVAGIKSHRQAHATIGQLIDCFGDKPLAKFSKHDLDRYKIWRFEQGNLSGEKGRLDPTQRDPVKISTVNRGLAILKHLLNEAYHVGLIARNVTVGSKAIDTDAETARTRTLTDAEEKRLLASCSGKRKVRYKRKGTDVEADASASNPHLRAIILLGLDSGLRRSEILTLDWKDIDLENGIIRVLGTHTKTQRTRLVPMSSRTRAELLSLPNAGTGGPVFPFNEFKRSWRTALRIAGITGLTFHDLRRTFVTRLQTGGVAIGIAAELAGHARIETTQKHYTSTDNPAVILDAAARIDAANDARELQWPDVID